MKHRFLMIGTFFIVMAITTVFFAGITLAGTKTLAGQKTTIQAKTIPNTTGMVRLVKESNPYPTSVWAYACPCKDSVEPNGAILMKGVIVHLVNKKCPGKPTANPVNGKVKFTWFDLKTNQSKFVIKPFTNLTNALDIVMIPHTQTILAKKNSHLVAEIIEINGVKDCNLSNTIRIATCVVKPVY
jgi:hypothetical protein